MPVEDGQVPDGYGGLEFVKSENGEVDDLEVSVSRENLSACPLTLPDLPAPMPSEEKRVSGEKLGEGHRTTGRPAASDRRGAGR